MMLVVTTTKALSPAGRGLGEGQQHCLLLRFYLVFWRAEASAILRLAGNFSSDDKKLPKKNVFFLPSVPVRDRPYLSRARTARFVRAVARDGVDQMFAVGFDERAVRHGSVPG